MTDRNSLYTVNAAILFVALMLTAGPPAFAQETPEDNGMETPASNNEDPADAEEKVDTNDPTAAPWSFNWQEKQWLIPMGIRVGRLFKSRKGVWNAYMEYRWPIVWKDWPGAVAEDTLRLQVSFTPKPLSLTGSIS
jgi:hypothetical protein